jgi:hypothetical protein
MSTASVNVAVAVEAISSTPLFTNAPVRVRSSRKIGAKEPGLVILQVPSLAMVPATPDLAMLNGNPACSTSPWLVMVPVNSFWPPATIWNVPEDSTVTFPLMVPWLSHSAVPAIDSSPGPLTSAFQSRSVATVEVTSATAANSKRLFHSISPPPDSTELPVSAAPVDTAGVAVTRTFAPASAFTDAPSTMSTSDRTHSVPAEAEMVPAFVTEPSSRTLAVVSARRVASEYSSPTSALLRIVTVGPPTMHASVEVVGTPLSQ